MFEDVIHFMCFVCAPVFAGFVLSYHFHIKTINKDRVETPKATRWPQLTEADLGPGKLIRFTDWEDKTILTILDIGFYSDIDGRTHKGYLCWNPINNKKHFLGLDQIELVEQT